MRSIALVGTYPPTECGLATFAKNLRSAIVETSEHWRADVVRVLDRWEYSPDSEVAEHWVTGDEESLQRSIEALQQYDAVLLQHEFGIYGGSDGDDVLALVRSVHAPIIPVLHTVLEAPSANQRRVIDGLLDSAPVAVVHSEAARERLMRVHGACSRRVSVVPHGAAMNMWGPPLRKLPHPVVLTWGLITPGKGIEYGIEAIAKLQSSEPSPFYMVAGGTHPKVLAVDGESYRHQLMTTASTLGVEDRVIFEDGYRDWASLHALIRGADAVLLPYESRDQVSSGVLVEALASAKPIVSTRFPHAEELLSGGAGVLVEQGDVEAMAAAINRIFCEPEFAARLRAAARRVAVPLLWSSVAGKYCALLDRVIGEEVRI